MLKEQGYIEKFSDDMLLKYGLSSNDRNIIKYLTDKAISEKLYTNTKDFQHNLKHVERVITYARMIMNNINLTINEEILMYAALYHDIGKTLGASNQEHGKIGSDEFEKMMKGKIDDKKIDIISKLIFQHAIEEDKIDFSNSNYTIEEQMQIQLMSDILKDADALDRNRLNYPAPIGACDINKLRTPEAKKILSSGLTDSLYNDYYKIIISEKQKNSSNQIMDNYDLLNNWIRKYEKLENQRNYLKNQYKDFSLKYGLLEISKKNKNGKRKTIDEMLHEMSNNILKNNMKNSDLEIWLSNYNFYKEKEHENMFHASLDPSIDALIPKKSTQAGEYVYGAIDPVSCFKMASFRSSSIFPRKKDKNGVTQIMEIFPNSINNTLESKFLTFYRLPSDKFEEYKKSVTAAPSGEWVSKEKVQPIEQISFSALDLISKFVRDGKIGIINYESLSKSELRDLQLESYLRSFEQYIWQIKSLENNPNVMNETWNLMQINMNYYLESEDAKREENERILPILNSVKKDIDLGLQSYFEDIRKKTGKEVNYEDEENVLEPFIEKYREKIYEKDTGNLNYEYINSLKYEKENVQKKHVQESKKAFDQRSEVGFQIATRLMNNDHEAPNRGTNSPKSNIKPISVKKGPEVKLASFTKRNNDEKTKYESEIKPKNIEIHKKNEQQRSLDKPKVKTLTKPTNNGGGSSSNGFVDTLILTLITGFVAGAIFMIVYSILK